MSGWVYKADSESIETEAVFTNTKKNETLIFYPNSPRAFYEFSPLAEIPRKQFFDVRDFLTSRYKTTPDRLTCR